MLDKMEVDSKFYPLPTESLPGLDFSDHIADLREIKEFLNSHDIPTKNTRIERYIQYLTQVINEGAKNESLVFKNSADERFKSSSDWLLYVLREVHELMWILRGLKVHIPAGLGKRLETIVSGSDFAALDTNPHCRNIQFELRIASYFCQAGCEVDLTTDTDVVALTDEFTFFVECKRIGSMSQFQRRLTEAAKQLHRRMPKTYKNRIAFGCIAADVTKVAFTHNGLTWALTNEHSRDIIQKKLFSIANTTTRMPLLSGSRNIILHWLQIHIPSRIIQPPTTTTRFSSYHIQSPGNARKALSAINVLRNISEIANKRDERETPPQTLTPRTTFTFPTGTEFLTVNDDLLSDLLERGQITGMEKGYVVAELTLNGFKHEFNLQALEMFVASTSKSEMLRLAKKTKEARIELIAAMYMRRYPYENSAIAGKMLSEKD